MSPEVNKVQAYYPLIYFACHTRHVSDEGKGARITAHQASILDHLDDKVSIALQELALHMGVTPSTMSVNIDRLAALKYVKREKDKSDSRKVKLFLTAAGIRIKTKRSVLDPQLVSALLLRLTREEVADALKGLALLAHAATMEMKSKSVTKAWASRTRSEIENHTIL